MANPVHRRCGYRGLWGRCVKTQFAPGEIGQFPWGKLFVTLNQECVIDSERSWHFHLMIAECCFNIGRPISLVKGARLWISLPVNCW